MPAHTGSAAGGRTRAGQQAGSPTGRGSDRHGARGLPAAARLDVCKISGCARHKHPTPAGASEVFTAEQLRDTRPAAGLHIGCGYAPQRVAARRAPLNRVPAPRGSVAEHAVLGAGACAGGGWAESLPLHCAGGGRTAGHAAREPVPRTHTGRQPAHQQHIPEQWPAGTAISSPCSVGGGPRAVRCSAATPHRAPARRRSTPASTGIDADAAAGRTVRHPHREEPRGCTLPVAPRSAQLGHRRAVRGLARGRPRALATRVRASPSVSAHRGEPARRAGAQAGQ